MKNTNKALVRSFGGGMIVQQKLKKRGAEPGADVTATPAPSLALLQCAFCVKPMPGFDAYVGHILTVHPDRGAYLHDVVRLITGAKPSRGPRVIVDGRPTSRFSDRLAKAFANDPGEDDCRADVLLRQATAAMYHAGGGAGRFALDAMLSLAPRDGLEAMLCGQMAALHSQGMEYLRRAALSNQTSEGVDCNVNRATRLLRTFCAQVEALRAWRGGSEQKITVQHQHVNVAVAPGAKAAIVGNVTSEGEGVNEKN